MTDMTIEPPKSPRGDTWLKSYYFTRAAVAAVWIAAALTLGKSMPVAAGALLVAYPALDAAANLFDAQRNDGLKLNSTQTLNTVVSGLTAAAVAIALGIGMKAVFVVFAVWACLAGFFQLATGIRRWKSHGGQWVMILSGAQSMVVGSFFYFVTAKAPAAPTVTDLVGYAGLGAFYFLVSAVWLTVSDMQHRNAPSVGA